MAPLAQSHSHWSHSACSAWERGIIADLCSGIMAFAETALVLLRLLISGTIGLIVLFTIGYMGGFVMNLVVPITIDKRPEWYHPPQISSSPLLNNVLLLLLFTIQHSAMPRGPLKTFLHYLLPELYYKPFYSLVSTVLLQLIFFCWHPMPTIIWDVQNPTLWYIIMGLNALSWLSLVVSLIILDPLALFGIKEPLTKLLGWKTSDKIELVVTGPYGLVRHPVNTSFMLAIWITPSLTVGHFLLSSVFTGYIVFAVAFYEEPDLVNTLGPEYTKYMKKTPRFFPNLPSFGRKAARD